MSRKGVLVVIEAFVLGALVVYASPAFAADKTLEFQLVTKALDPHTIDIPNVEGQSLTQSKAFGVGVFKDGRLATKDFVVVRDSGKDAVSLLGYSTYTFDDGSTLTMSFTAKGDAKQQLHGDYKILSGTGAYKGATGKGTFDLIQTKMKNASFYNVKLQVTTPSA